MSAWTDGCTRGPRRGHAGVASLATYAAACAAACVVAASRAGAQDTTVVTPPTAPAPTPRRASVFELLNLDKLQLASLGGSVGRVRPANVVPTQLYSLQADYGEIAPGVRVVFVATYWGSQYTRRSIRIFEEALATVVRDPSGDDTVSVGTVRVQDVSLGTDVRWSGWGAGTLRTFAGGGVAAHVINAEGRPVSGTFVESALDNIAAGAAAFAGVDFAPLPNLTLEMQARYDLFSGVRYASVRAGASYVFDAVRGPTRRGR